MAFDKNDIVGETFTNTKGVKFKVERYWDRDTKQRHTYIVEFPDTGNKYKADRAKIKRKTPRDEKRRAIEKKIKKRKKVKNKIKQQMKVDNYNNNCVYMEKSVKDMSILALDQSTIKTGYCVSKKGKLTEKGLLYEKGDDINTRINALVAKVRHLAKENEIDLIILEDIYMGRAGVVTFKKLAWVQGCLINLAIDLGVEFLIIKASEWKSYWNILGGHSGEQKIKGTKLVKQQFNIRVQTDDVSDVILMCKYAEKERIKKNVCWN